MNIKSMNSVHFITYNFFCRGTELFLNFQSFHPTLAGPLCWAHESHKHCCVIINVWVFSLGGYDGIDFLSSIEGYNPETNVWTEYTNMTCGRSGHGVAVGTQPCSP